MTVGAPELSAVPRLRAFVGMGGNLGEVSVRLTQALGALARLPGTSVEAASGLYRTRPVDADGPDFINAVVVLQTALGPHELLAALLGIEREHDRQRPYLNAPRTLDLDLLALGDARLCTPTLTLPHPRQQGRAFVMVPLAELLAHLPPQPGSPLPCVPDAPTLARMSQEQGIERLPGELLFD